MANDDYEMDTIGNNLYPEIHNHNNETMVITFEIFFIWNRIFTSKLLYLLMVDLFIDILQEPLTFCSKWEL